MSIKKLKPTTPGQRFYIAPDYSGLAKKKPEKSLTVGLKKKGGRNNQGRMTIRNVGGGHKRKYRIIDFKRQKAGIIGVVKAIEYDPNRTAFIALIYYKNGDKSYIIAPEALKPGDEIQSGSDAPPTVGNALPLKNMPVGTIIHNIELTPGKGASLVRSAGGYAQLVSKDEKYCSIKLPSGETRQILSVCYATVGTVSNASYTNTNIGKAGRNRWLGRRPRVRGVAMNPVDHPMGGGEGKASGGHPRSRAGLIAKGKKTRSKKKYSNRFILSKK